MTNKPKSEYTTKEVYDYLDELRDSGITNMFGAGTYLQEKFDITKYEANRYLINWMETYKQ